ncbi:RICIN domain-containing protein [Streptomyces mexicanus]|uniref:RICIN domain-containing protein n=1 Tax=Streptomyces mexicanus TaxID=178566 RepID=UPI0036BF8C5D
MSDVLRLGGPSMAAVAQDGLNQPPDKLHVLADRRNWEETPLATAFEQDRDASAKELDEADARRQAWYKPLQGLETPAGFTDADFHWPPGSPGDGKQSFDAQTGLSQWIADRFWKDENDFYKDSTPKADDKTRAAVSELGAPLYGEDPHYTPGMTPEEWNRLNDEHSAFEWLYDGPDGYAGADDARIFLAAGGFPRSAPEPGTADYRIAVEDLKARFASCAWRDPLDPDRVLGDVTASAATEWQQEIASQATQRNQILDANEDATKALVDGAQALSQMLGHSWVADHLTRWRDYWSPGGVGYIGDAPAVIEVHAAQGKCLDVEGGRTDNGTPVQIYTCNGGAAQRWTVEGDDTGLHLRNTNSSKCLDVSGTKPDNGTKIQIWTCNSSPAQTWEYNLRATTQLKNTATGKCLDLHSYDNGYNAQLYTCNGTGAQQLDIKPSGHTGSDKETSDHGQIDQASRGILQAQIGAGQALSDLKTQLAAAQKAAAASDTAEQAAYAIADANGAPRGRGLLAGQQKAQVTKGVVAALQAMVKAGETAKAATSASAADSQAIAQRALAQAAQAKAEFRKEAAYEAELQAKAAADAAKIHRDNAKKDKETAEDKLALALKAEGDAKAAAADAHAKRLAAEAEEKTAKAEKETAAAKQAEAEQHKKNAATQAAAAKDAEDKAKAAEATAESKRDDAVKARDDAKAKRDDAWDAEQKANAARAKADAKAAYADSLDAGAAADAARTAANEADQHADDAEAAAAKARSEADAATKAAADADAAATRAEAAAKRARSDADAAKAAKLKADAAVKTATSAAADAIKAAQGAALEAKTAVQLANEAETHVKDAKTQADQAQKEAATALAASTKATGYAYVTAQAAVDAAHAAEQVADPANDAIQLGSPYITTDSAAGLVVLTGQASKTIAEQQKAVAEAHAKNAQEEAAAAKVLAEQAQADAKEAYQHSANAAGYAADARAYANDALDYAAAAAAAASKAAASLARTVAYDQQAAEDAKAADQAAGRAEGYATDARDSADQAALDAEAAREAATEAEQAAKDAREAAEQADAAATEAEQAAKDADTYAQQAQEAADAAERKENAKQIETGTVPDETGAAIGNMFYVVDKAEKIGEPEVIKKENCNPIIHTGDCKITAKIQFKAVLDLYMCNAQDLDLSQFVCPASATVYLGEYPTKELSTEVTDTISMTEFNQGIDPVNVLFGDWIKCIQKIAPGGQDGSWSGCAWAAVDVASLFAGKILKPIADAVRAADAAARTGVGFVEAWKSLKALGFGEGVVSGIAKKIRDILRQSCPALGKAVAARSAAISSADQCMPPLLDDVGEEYVRSKHVEGGSLVTWQKGVFDADVDLDELVYMSENVKPVGPNPDGHYERIVDAGRLIGRTSEQNGKKPTSWFLLSQDKWGSVRTMYPVEKPIDPIG